LLCAAQLSCQNDIERLDFFLGPFHASAHHWRWETALKAQNGVVNNGKVHKRQLPNVEMEISLENALSATQHVSIETKVF
jgi:hypothetical protein